MQGGPNTVNYSPNSFSMWVAAVDHHIGFHALRSVKLHSSNNIEATLSNPAKSNAASTFSATMLKQRYKLLPVALIMLLRHCVVWTGLLVYSYGGSQTEVRLWNA